MAKATWIREYLALALILVALVLLFGALSGRFLSVNTFGAIANRIPTLALIGGGIDLSIGSVLGRWMFATGSNETATHFSGIDPRPIKLTAHALTGASGKSLSTVDTAAGPNDNDSDQAVINVADATPRRSFQFTTGRPSQHSRGHP